MNKLKIFSLVIILLTFSLNVLAADFKIEINQTQEMQGGYIHLVIEENNPQKLKVYFNNKPITLFPNANNNLEAYLGISYWLTPGTYPLVVYQEDKLIFQTDIEVLAEDFQESFITVEEEKEDLISKSNNPQLEEKKKKDSLLLQEATRLSSRKKLWEGNFMWPLKGKITTEFGATRYVNGKLSSRHSGIDIAAPTGTPIKAANNGIVKLAADLVVTGKTVIIDHGWGIYSTYSHLNDFNVSSGEEIKKGEIIGTVGSTGFSTGPHLHWVIKINGVYVNPEKFLEISNPPSSATSKI